MENKKIFKLELKSLLGRFWLIFLLKCKFLSKRLYKSTRWVKKSGAESQFVKRLSLSYTIYLELQKKITREKAFEIIRNIIIAIGINEMYQLVHHQEIDPLEKLIDFFVSIRINGVGKFVNRNLIKANNNTFEYEVRNCVFVRFFYEVGTPELAQLFCEVDMKFFPKAFPEFEFSRGNSFKNTQAYGNEYCIFKFDRINEVRRK